MSVRVLVRVRWGGRVRPGPLAGMERCALRVRTVSWPGIQCPHVLPACACALLPRPPRLTRGVDGRVKLGRRLAAQRTGRAAGRQQGHQRAQSIRGVGSLRQKTGAAEAGGAAGGRGWSESARCPSSGGGASCSCPPTARRRACAGLAPAPPGQPAVLRRPSCAAPAAPPQLQRVREEKDKSERKQRGTCRIWAEVSSSTLCSSSTYEAWRPLTVALGPLRGRRAGAGQRGGRAGGGARSAATGAQLLQRGCPPGHEMRHAARQPLPPTSKNQTATPVDAHAQKQGACVKGRRGCEAACRLLHGPGSAAGSRQRCVVHAARAPRAPHRTAWLPV